MSTNKAAILKQIGAIGKAARRVTTEVQKCAVACVLHAVEHGDVTLCDELVEALGKGMRKASLRAWFEVNTCVILDGTKGTFKLDKERAKTLRDAGEEKVTKTLMALPWEEAKPEEKVVSVLDVAEAFDKFMARLDKMVKGEGVTVKHREMLETLRSVSAEYHSAEATAA